MAEAGLHVVFGTGQVGSELVARLVREGVGVRAVSRHRPATLPDGSDWRLADARDAEATADAAKGAAVVYQCLNAPYTRWPQEFPPLQRNLLAAAERSEAVLVSLENVYGYGPVGGRPMTEDLPLAATSTKGRARAAMTAELLAAQQAGRVQIAIGRAADLFGPGVTASTLGSRAFENALAGKPVDVLGDPDLLHSYSYARDVAAGLATLGTDDRALGQVWHLPGPETVTTRALVELIGLQLGRPVPVRAVAPFVVRALALVVPSMRGLSEMSYEFQQPFVLDTTRFDTTFGSAATPLTVAVRETTAWYQARANGA